MKIVYKEKAVSISQCGKYRYLLRRLWDDDKPRALFVMLNPSTADAEIDDPTIRSCTRLADGLGYGSFEVVNLYGVRTSDPSVLETVSDPVGPHNKYVIDSAISRCDMIICAWGAHPMAERRAQDVITQLRAFRPAVFCFGVTKSGAPKHPLYIKSGTQLRAYDVHY